MGNRFIKREIFPLILPIVYFLSGILLLNSCSKAGIRLSSETVIIENIPFYPQKDYQCGPASLASVLNFWGYKVDPDEIAKNIFSKSAKGTLNIDMVLYAKRIGLYSAQYSGNWEDLRKNIEMGNPLIVLVDYGIKPFFQVNHFMVIIGYNKEGVIVNSDKRERLFIEKDRFLDLWQKTGYWTLLIKRQEDLN